MNKRTFPLFIIDTSRSHGRGEETDYISCTSNELPFVARVTLHGNNEYKELYSPSDFLTVWSEPRNNIRMRVSIVSQLPDDADKTLVRSLLKRALKEIVIRKSIHTIDIGRVDDADVLRWAEVLEQQVVENLRESPGDKTQKMNLAILNAIKGRFK